MQCVQKQSCADDFLSDGSKVNPGCGRVVWNIHVKVAKKYVCIKEKKYLRRALIHRCEFANHGRMTLFNKLISFFDFLSIVYCLVFVLAFA